MKAEEEKEKQEAAVRAAASAAAAAPPGGNNMPNDGLVPQDLNQYRLQLEHRAYNLLQGPTKEHRRTPCSRTPWSCCSWTALSSA
eukprot:6747154-Pyramimonas_sp.AAC.1